VQTAQVDASLQDRLLELINASWTTQAIHAACVLKLPDLLEQGCGNVADLAAATGSNAAALHRLLRALVTLEIVTERGSGEFHLAPAGQMLRERDESSLHSWALQVGGAHWTRWGELVQSVRTGRSYRQRHDGQDGFEHLDADEEAAARFHRSMVEMTRRVAHAVVRAVDFSGAGVIADVGGSSGELLATVLAAHPGVHGLLFDQAHALAHAPEVLRAHGVQDRCDLCAGSFFEHIPSGADVILLKSVLHNWDDARCVEILRRCRQALAARARLLIIERLVPERLGATAADRALARSDVNMLVALSGRERRLDEFRALLDSAELNLQRVWPTASEFCVVEAGLP
jgi:hypothetical protein